MCLVLEYDLEIKSGSNLSMPHPVASRLGRSERLLEVLVSSTYSSLNESSSNVSLNKTSDSRMSS